MLTVPEALQLAVQHHQAGNLQQAEQIYRAILQADPQQVDALHLLGLIASQVGQHEAAIACIGQALGYKPDFPEAHYNLGNVLSGRGKLEEAVAHYQQAVRLKPDFVEAHNNLGLALQAQGKLKEARVSLREALRLRPDFAEAHNNLGNVRKQRGKWEEAAGHYQQALRHKPDFAEAHNNLGTVLKAQRKPEEAAARYQEALRLRPDYAEAHVNLGAVRREQGRLEDAVAHFRQALRLQPDLAEACEGLATTLTRQGLADEALACLREGLRRHPGRATLHTSLGETLVQLGRPEEARAAFEEVLRLGPHSPLAHSCLLNLLNLDPATEPAAAAEAHRRWASLHARVDVLGPAPGHDRTPDRRLRVGYLSARRLRVGYLSADLRQHVLAHFVMPILAHHDPEQVEITCYADVAAPDGRTAQFQSLARQWRSIHGRSDAEAAQMVRDDAIDILVDLGGHTGNRLGVFARQPAPVQVTYLGYPNTTGLPTIHYRLTDAVADPSEEQAWYTEQLVRLPGGFCCYTPPHDAPDVSPPPVLATGTVTFGSLHKLAKLNGAVLELWSRVLHALPSSRLLVFRDALQGSALAYFREQFARHGLAEDRVLLQHPEGEERSFLKVYDRIDVSLDTFPWGGHVTACESLWMGVPMLTLQGPRHAARMVSSALTQVGLTDLIARTPEEFVAKAVQLAQDPNRLVELRSGLRRRMHDSPLCDGKTFTRHLEEAYREMWRNWVKGG
jgi:predicted O-linked N-acetylglucosamine transferase (SPINDLY family)